MLSILKMRSFVLLTFLCLVGWSISKRCPAEYLKFTPKHSFCLKANRSCQVMLTGVSEEDKEIILDLHNRFRSKTAMGNEDRARDGTLPQAADMMQMEWDDELAAIAQKWTQNCIWDHDCQECRAVENFDVGQNLAIQHPSCDRPGSEESDWTWAITALYGEVKDYYVSWLDSYIRHPGPKTGHLTALIWSTSWRVGCGYSFYKDGEGCHRFYGCNYGPGGNMEKEPVYKQGRPCSACPTNTQCSTSRRNPYPGLCKMTDPDTAPIYPRSKKNLLFYCSASTNDPDCKAQVSGSGGRRSVSSLGGNYESLVLRGGQSASITFDTPVKPSGNEFCIVLNFRKGPVDASKRDVSSLKTDFKIERGIVPGRELGQNTAAFTKLPLSIPWNKKTIIGFTFSVPRGAGQHALDIRGVEVYDGDCDSRRG